MVAAWLLLGLLTVTARVLGSDARDMLQSELEDWWPLGLARGNSPNTLQHSGSVVCFRLIRPHRSTTYVDATEYHGLSVDLSVSLSRS